MRPNKAQSDAEHLSLSEEQSFWERQLPGSQIDETDAQRERIVSGSFLILLNAHDQSVPFRLSARARDLNWELVFDTSSAKMTRWILGRLAEYPLQGRSVAVLCRCDDPA